MIPYGRQTIEADDIQAVTDVLKSPFLTTGPKVSEFEQAVSRYVGASHAVAVSSGTAALHTAVVAAGIQPKDEVLVPALSFAASANAVLYAGGRPVFVDSLPGEFNLDPADLEKKITKRTKAIVAVHFAGQPADLASIRVIAKRHRLVVIEDAAHALGAVYDDRPIGTHSTLTVFSFHPVKHITTGEGGMITTGDAKLAQRMRRFRHHGIDVDATERDAQQRWQYDMVDLGYNYRITDFQCALGISQLKKIERFLQRREAIAARYDAAFKEGSVGEIPPRSPGSRHAWHLYVLRLPATNRKDFRDQMFARLRAQDIGVHVHYQPIYRHSYYRRLGWKTGRCPQIEKTFPRMLTLPLYPGLTDEQVDQIISAVQQAAKFLR